MAEKIRVQKAIANAGLMSRRAAEEAMVDGRVQINGRDVILGDRVDVEVDLVTFDGVPVPVNPDIETYLLYKPVGVISTASDPQNRKTVVEFIESSARLYPVGRLDADSEGLILITNDGELTNQVTHPRFGVTKTYLALVTGTPTSRSMRQLTAGIELDDGPAKAMRAHLVESFGDRSLVELMLADGRNREVRRMMDALGYPVISLVRTAIGSLTDRNLKAGEWRRLDADELRKVFL